ncbi:hypothetical protein GAYE_SCF19G4016 [Galdieria yellowstonensis]|uniref:UDP-N-acetylglucosamine transferase subunit ALG13 n=1 Tax=Galdieria yellowstonensis TaxID=3028027 RepID=A0AAV9IFC5_9RHOD|nr:hypothetical protein GAYE_SCF19G4016 [Galdieria yellowstonensis]
MSEELRFGRVFVTVGSTQFDQLIFAVHQQSFLETLHSLGVQELRIQYGKGRFFPLEEDGGKLKVESFRYKPSIVEDINWADLVISHGGAGSILESLRAKKKLIIVVNEKLMHNHQMELAEAMVRNGYAFLASTDSLVETLKNADFRELKPLPEPNVFPVVTVLLQEVSFTE